MNDLRAAAQQALEALEKYRKMMFVETGCRFGEGDAAITNLRSALAQQVEPDHETRAELAEQQVVQLAEERDHYRNLWQKAQQAEPLNLADPAVRKRLASQWGYVPAAAQAEPVQEPVAWYRPSIAPDYYAPVFVEGAQPPAPLTQAEARLLGWRPLVPPQQAEPVGQLAELQAMLRAEVDRLIAAGIQPQRKLVPLTEEEIKTAFHAARNAKLGASQDNSRHRLSVIEIARVVERAHGIT